MITPTLALAAAVLPGPGVCLAYEPLPAPPAAAVSQVSPDAWDHYQRDLQIAWGIRDLQKRDCYATLHGRDR